MMFPYRSPDAGHYFKVHKQSLYLPMRDGVELAVDVWLPRGLKPGTRLPALLHQTRYWRGAELRWPFSVLGDGLLGHEGKLVRELVLNGYAFVNVDCRGSGASFGNRLHPWSPAEVQDGYEVADWIIRQPWSNGILGAVGISYTGTTAEFARGLAHPAIKAVMPLFSLYDIFDDIALPGGIPHDGFVVEWGRANAMLDANRIPLKDVLSPLLVKGVAPVGKGRDARLRLREALLAHRENLGVHETSAGIEFRDQAPRNQVVRSMDDFSPHAHQHAGDRAGVPMLSLSGWRDGAYPHASIRRFLNTTAAVNRLVIGPWDHGGKNHITPGKERKLGTDLGSEAIKFFDHYLKGYATGIDREPRVQYYVMQAEEWRGCEAWPPPGSGTVPFYLQPGGHLSNLAGNEGIDAVPLVHNPAQGTGHYTRWRGLRLSLGTGRLYPDRKYRDRLLACWDSDVLERDMEVTGHCVAHLFVRTQEADGSFFVYLEDLTPGGEVWYVTEGALRAIHRRIGNGTPPYKDVVPFHSYLAADAEPIPAGEVVELRFDLLPVAYLFRKGHRVRVAIATGDRDNFRQLCREGSVYEVMMGMSRVELAVKI
jgi:uncharacterized protein